MTVEHKEAIRRGRLQASVVKTYLESLGVDRRRVSDAATLNKRLAAVEDRIAKEASVLKSLELHQQRLELRQSLRQVSAETGDDIEKDFVSVAAEFAKRKGLTYAAFREMGVSAKVLKAAGIKRA